jgi:hypothetical protein
MKSLTKKIAAVGLGAMIGGATLGLAACSDGGATQLDVSSEELDTYLVNKNAYIVVTENDVSTLHKGDMVVPYLRYGSGFSYVVTPILKFNCGKELQTYQFVVYTQACPKEEKYDAVCDCAYELKLESASISSASASAEGKNATVAAVKNAESVREK